MVHLNSPGLGIRVVWPSENHKGNWRSSSWAVAWKQVAISLCKIVAFFRQKLAIRSGPGALQSFFLVMILFSIQIPAISRYFRYYVFNCLSNLLDPFCFRVSAPLFFPQTFPETTRFINVSEIWLLTCVPCVTLSYFGLSISAWLSTFFPKVAYILPGSA